MEDRFSKLFEEAKNSIIEGDEDLALEIVKRADEEGADLMDLLLNGFGAGNEAVADDFDKKKISIAELIYATEIMKSVTEETFSLLDLAGKAGAVSSDKCRVLLATVAGDIHDIGKTIVAAFLRSAGFEVIDLGCEVPVEAIAVAAKEFNVDIIGTSALLTTTIKEQKKLEKYLRETGERNNYITMVGGAPVTQRWAEKIGADGYSDSARDAVSKALELISKKNKDR